MYTQYSLLIVFLLVTLRCRAVNPSDYPQQSFRCGGSGFDCEPLSFLPHCIPFHKVRDCQKDCPHSQDEACPVGQILCDEHVTSCGQCVPIMQQTKLCQDRKWHHICVEKNAIRCLNTMNCVRPEWINNGVNECGDNSDEEACERGLVKCSTATANATNTTTKPKTTVKPTLPVPIACDLGMFRCVTGECIEDGLVLDGKKDCNDGSDEEYCKKMSMGECISESKPCSYHPDIAAFGCGCPRFHTRNSKGKCVRKTGRNKI